MVISIASGKGGTGKTTVAVNLARVASEALRVQVLDCDVEEPNCHVFLRPVAKTTEDASVLTPSVDTDTCSRCGLCAEVCAFHAIMVSPLGVVVLPELCHGCGACEAVCPTHSISENSRPIGAVIEGESTTCPGVSLCYGALRPGEALMTPVISAVRRRSSATAGMVIVDSPPGTSCGMVHSVKDSDFCILVTEPTPLGLHDLQLAWETTVKLGIPSGVVINRAGLARTDVKEFCRERAIRVLLEIPLDRKIAEAYSGGEIIADALPTYRTGLGDLVGTLVDMGATQR